MKALDTNVLVRFLVADDERQGLRVKSLFEAAEESGESFLVTTPVLLELIWVLSAVYDFTRDELTEALELLSEMPILEFEGTASLPRLIELGRSTTADPPDLLVGLVGRGAGCETTLTFERGLDKTELFERL